MDSLGTSSLQHQFLNDRTQPHRLIDTNISSLQQDDLNGKFIASNETHNVTASGYPIQSVASFLMCVVGMPGNLVVIAVYARTMTTSTRVYMFALAVADLTVCTCGIVLTTIKFAYISLEVITYSVHTALTFSVLLLAFVSIERLLAVRRPHTFSLSSLRAKRALVVIAVASAVCAVLLAVARVKRFRLLLHVVPAVVTVTSVVVMIVCYSLMAMTMMMNIRAAHRNVGVTNKTPAPGPSTAPTGIYIVSHGKAMVGVTSSKNSSLSRITKTTAKQTNTYKSVLVLFVITVVYLACWIPHWLHDVGLDVPQDVGRMFILNSVVNPFIYSVVSRMFRDDVRQFYGQMRSRLVSYHC